jgi:2,3-bisphosphoglycerate-dependent phosphoglycerate mutase
MTSILLARHGETDWNRELRVQGQADPPLNALGREQARDLAERLAEVELDAVYSSDLRRARETAEIIAGARGLGVLLDPDLREVDTGNWTGLTREEISDRFPADERHDGETREQLRARVVAGVQRIVRRHPGGRLLIVSHGGALRALWHHAGGAAIERMPNCSVYRIAFENGSFRWLD